MVNWYIRLLKSLDIYLADFKIEQAKNKTLSFQITYIYIYDVSTSRNTCDT